ncbi:hypothetical protein CONCODRAFT_9318 [Conidiobolus coronatus NRRL 28638]|uniref:Uncharacterized protein n=1 Tax=Conidiobolus coronatus (strain ATCC 28846 / CBS 209.66 / NRRL 28638) TaxID=796925 RepID=A0A137P0D6_CONC2|nr:hypothetical protein CONCODRAFT_9318 [Conidiobolus coronatus NRRL 28638]|eukprot:KXN68428.1 hypothetical protein CONCODRAFT_9318 [Conidiobolus coronatus NRRL 28638]
MHLNRRDTSFYFYQNWVYYLIASLFLLVVLIVATALQLRKYGKAVYSNSTVKEEDRAPESGEKQMVSAELEGSGNSSNNRTEEVIIKLNKNQMDSDTHVYYTSTPSSWSIKTTHVESNGLSTLGYVMLGLGIGLLIAIINYKRILNLRNSAFIKRFRTKGASEGYSKANGDDDTGNSALLPGAPVVGGKSR